MSSSITPTIEPGLGKRDVTAASGATYDLIIVGGGVHGLCATLHAARAGVRVLLIERDDFASQTSANSLQILHGGFRYLQNLDLARVRESARARSWWMESFPDLTEPLECVLPLDGQGTRRPEIFRAALALHHRLARLAASPSPGAERGLPSGWVDPAARRPEIAALLAKPPRFFATWFDGLFPRPGRIAIELLRWAVQSGATALSHVEARQILMRSDASGRREVAGIRAFDHEAGREFELHATRVLNFAGPWNGWVENGNLHPPSIAFNLLFRGILPDGAALGVRSRDGKNLFLWERDRCIHVGTRHLSWSASLHRPVVEPARIDELIDDLRWALPGLGLERRDLLAVQAGFLPAGATGGSEMAQRDRWLDHAARGGPAGLVSVSGIKYTTAPIVARRALHQVFGTALPVRSGRARTARNSPSVSEIAIALEEDATSAVDALRRLIDEEMVLHLDELILGRLDGLTLGPALFPFAERLVSCLGWDVDRSARELARFETRLRTHLPPTSSS